MYMTVVNSKNIINSFSMKNQQLFYATNQLGYYHTTKSTHDPIIIQSRSRNVTLPYRVCNEIFKGKSKFTNPKAEEFYNECMQRRQTKDIEKSQATNECSQAGETSTRNYNQKRGLGSKKQNYAVMPKQYYKQNISHLSNQKSKTNEKNLQKQDRLYHSLHAKTEKKQQKISKILYKSEISSDIEQVLSENESQFTKVVIDPFEQIQRLKRLLLTKENQLSAVKKQLKQTQIRQKKLLESAAQVKYNNMLTENKKIQNLCGQLRQQVDGTVPALLYLVLFVVLLTKHTMSE